MAIAAAGLLLAAGGIASAAPAVTAPRAGGDRHCAERPFIAELECCVGEALCDLTCQELRAS